MLAAGQSIGNYQILSKIGTGGMGAVYLAEHPLIGKKVALKVIHRELANNREVVQRFFQEARSVNKIGNEHIVEIHDFGQSPEGDHFYIMEYLEGATLAQVLTRERALEPMRALYICAQIASALGAAHAAGIIHRDLKPDNIMLMRRLGDPDFVKVLDFGLAKVFSAANAVKTAAGVLLGTPQYMSPEACESKRDQVDHRTDIYALGVLLFQMTTGVLPFDGQTMGEVLIKQVTALPPAPRGLNPAIPPSVEQVILRCLAKAPDARFPTMTALRDALLDPEAYLRASPPMAAARSVAPGEMGFDAKAVLAHAAADQKTRLGMSAPMPLAAPPSLGGIGYAPTAAHGAYAPPPGANAATMIADAAYVPPKRHATNSPGVAEVQFPKMNTMRIATPLGYSSRPQRRVWPFVLGFGLLAGLGVGIGAVVWFGGGEKTTPSQGSAVVVESPVIHIDAPLARDAPAAPVPDAPAANVSPIRQAKVTIETAPPGATLYGPDGAALGKTPLKLEWPIAESTVAFELRLPGYKKKPVELVVSGTTSVHIDLVRDTVRVPPPHHDDNGLMRPE